MMSLLKLFFFHKKHLVGLFNSRILNNIIVDNCHYFYAKNKIKRLDNSPPRNFILETTNVCNAKCIMCGHNDMKRKQGFMTTGSFIKIVDDAKKCGIKYVTLQGYGEPLLDEHIFERVKYLKDNGIKVAFNTNASLLDETRTKLLLKSGLDEIFISLDAFSKNKFEKIRYPLIFEKIMNNIEKLLEIRKKKGLSKPFVTLTFVIQDENREEAKNFYHHWKNKCDFLIISCAKNWAGQVEVKSKSSPHIKNSHTINYNPCDNLWTQLYVQYNGKVALCCEDYEGSVVIGDLNKESVSDVWWGKKLKAYRDAHLSKRRTLMPLCKQCQKHINWFKVKT